MATKFFFYWYPFNFRGKKGQEIKYTHVCRINSFDKQKSQKQNQATEWYVPDKYKIQYQAGKLNNLSEYDMQTIQAHFW